MAVIATGLDYSARRLSGASIRAAGYTFVNRYLWFPGQGFPALTAGELLDLEANGIEVHAIYEQNTNDPAGGWNAGVAMARQAVQSAQAAGLPAGSTIYMCSDAWLATHGIPVSTAMSFLDGARSVLRPAGYLTGAYGFADFVYAAQDGGHADRFWLCGSESGVRAGIHQYQRNYRTNPNGPDTVDGVAVDINNQYLPMSDRAPGGGGGSLDEGEDDMAIYALQFDPSPQPARATLPVPYVGGSESVPDGGGAWARLLCPSKDVDVWGLYFVMDGEPARLVVGPGKLPSAESGEKVAPVKLGHDLYTIYELPKKCIGVTLIYSSEVPVSLMVETAKRKAVSA